MVNADSSSHQLQSEDLHTPVIIPEHCSGYSAVNSQYQHRQKLLSLLPPRLALYPDILVSLFTFGTVLNQTGQYHQRTTIAMTISVYLIIKPDYLCTLSRYL